MTSPRNQHIEVVTKAIHGIATYPAGATYGPRRMNDWEFVWLLEGDAAYTRDGETFCAPPHSMILCRPDATDFFRWDTSRRTRHAFFHFDVRQIPTSWPSQNLWPVVRQPSDDDVLLPIFRHVLRALKRPVENVDTPENRLSIAHMLSLWVRGEGDSGDFAPERWPEIVECAWKFLHERLESEPDALLDLAQLARAAHTTPEHLCRVFKTATGWTPMEAVRLARLDRAATMLARSNYNVGEIARLCGFASAFHFSRRFRDAFGQSPREMRTALQNGAPPPLPRLLRLS